jgi:selenocysteine-specific elongation factor
MTASAVGQQTYTGRTTRSIVVGTAGHIDHGKTALIGALTGVDTDRLPEEKSRGITIDLGFASLDLEVPGELPARVSFIDVPGHARFVRNMLAGAGGIDAVLLIISAEEGVKPQTEEHLAICALLGIRCGITVLTKTDAVDVDRLDEVHAKVQQFLRGTFLAAEPLVSVSAFTGAGLDQLRRELALLAARVAQRSSESVMRIPLDRAFAVKGFGAVVTGTLMTGSVTSGQEVAIEPGGRTAKVRGVQVHGRQEARAEAATRVALNLSHVEAAELQRGLTLVEPATVAAVDTLDAEISLLPGAHPLKHRARIHFHAFATECMASVSLYGYQPVEPNSKRLARFKLGRPIVLVPGDRFVLRHGSPVTTIGGGIVLDARPLPWLGKKRTKAWLDQLQGIGMDSQLAARVARRGDLGITIAELTGETGLQSQSIRDFLAGLAQRGSITSLPGGRLFAHEALIAAAGTVRQELEKMFRDPGRAGVKRSALKSKLRLPAEVVDWAVQHLGQSNLVRAAGDELMLAANGAGADSLDFEEKKVAAIEGAFRTAGLQAPSPRTLGEELRIEFGEMRRLMTVLLREKRLVRLGDDALCMHRDVLETLKESVRLLRGQTMDVGRFKELTGVSRKYAIPLLEYLDQERVTRRQGEQRIVL